MPEKYKADPVMMSTMVTKITEFSLSELISTTKQYSRYGLDDENKTTVTAYNGNEILRKFDYGKESSSFQHTFIKMPDDPDIYQTPVNMPDTFDMEADSLRDKSVLTFNSSDILLFSITMSDGREITLNKTLESAEQTEDSAGEEGPAEEPEPKAVWHTADGAEFKSSEIENIIQTMSSLKCNSYMEEGAETGEILFTITLKGSMEYTLTVFNKTDEYYPAVSSMNDYVFNLASWQVENASNIFVEETTEE
jgi:hypothetical protein